MKSVKSGRPLIGSSPISRRLGGNSVRALLCSCTPGPAVLPCHPPTQQQSCRPPTAGAHDAAAGGRHRFCAVKSGNPRGWLDADEPAKVARYAEVSDLGAGHYAATIRALKSVRASLLVEALTPDFQGRPESVAEIVDAGVDVFAHNVETVERLHRRVRDARAGYAQTLGVLRAAKARAAATGRTLLTKSSIMLGLGETDQEVRATLSDLRSAGVDVVTLGQYLRPTSWHLPVERYVPPEEFAAWKRVAEEELGFPHCSSGPLVRSSYKAAEHFLTEHAASRMVGVSDLRDSAFACAVQQNEGES